MRKNLNNYEDIITTINKKYFPDLEESAVIEKMKHFTFVNEMLSDGPVLYTDGMQGSIPEFIKGYADNIINHGYSFGHAANSSILNMLVYVKSKNTDIYNNLVEVYKSTEKESKYFENDYVSTYRDGNLNANMPYPQLQQIKEASDFLCHLDFYGKYKEGKAVKDKDYDNYYYLKNIVEESELEQIEILYEQYKKGELNIDIDNLANSLNKIEKIGEKYDVSALSMPIFYLFMKDNTLFDKAIDKVNDTFEGFANRFHLDPMSVGLGKINYVFSRSLLTNSNAVAYFSPGSGFNKDYIGSIHLKEHIKNEEFVRVIDHEYAHAIDYYAGSQISSDGLFFSELPHELKMKNPKATEAIRKVVYAVSDLENEYLSKEKADSLAFEFQKDIFKSLLLHLFNAEDYAKLEQSTVNKVLDENKDKVLNIFDKISWKWMENRQKVDNGFIDLLNVKITKDFYKIYQEVGGNLNEKDFQVALIEPLNIVKDSILDYNSRRDPALNTFFKNPSNFAKEIANVSFNIETYCKEPTERFAWAVGGTDNEEIVPGVLSGFKDFCEAIGIKTNQAKIVNKDDLFKKLKDLKQLEVPKKLYTVKY